MKKRYTIIITGLLLFITATSCLKSLICVNGNGKTVTETRRSQSFTSIENTTSFEVIYRKADTFGISIEAESNIIDYIETNTDGENLEISTLPGTVCLNYSVRPIIRISSPDLTEAYNSGSGDMIIDYLSGDEVFVRLTGSGDISIDRIDADHLDAGDTGSGNLKISEASCTTSDLKVSGSGDITISGDCGSAHLKSTGSGNVYGNNLYTVSTSAITTGSGSIYVRVEEYLNGLLSGSGNIYYRGNPEIDQTATGSGRIIRQK